MKMKLSGKRIVLPILALILALMIWAGFFPPVSVSASADDYRYEITAFTVEMDVHEDRTIDVKEVITAEFSGYDSRGIIRDFPLGEGVTYSDINATCDHPDFDPYFKSDDFGFMSLYLRGDSLTRGQTRTYTITYQMATPANMDVGYIPLDVIGYGWQANLNNVTVVINAPNGLNSYRVYSGGYGTENNNYVQHSRTGNTVTLRATLLPRRFSDVEGNYVAAGITLYLVFDDGVLAPRVNVPLIIALCIGAGLIAIAVILKLFVFRQPEMVTPVNLSAPEESDPLKMGILIDNSVDAEDLGALVFWFASEGYVNIDLSEDEKDPRISMTGRMLPMNAPKYLKLFFEGLFDQRESVRVSELKNKFYKTADAVKADAKATVAARCEFYQKRSK
ncbi:MAG: DUF2207 domain-containing protein, partial [Clostridiales bacterium]|nr:DUF2207 domain-containing protein [Clostridiales bacterium]